ncbi:protein MpPPR_65 [Marchantia polymorpha subsp. ruderalis]
MAGGHLCCGPAVQSAAAIPVHRFVEQLARAGREVKPGFAHKPRGLASRPVEACSDAGFLASSRNGVVGFSRESLPVEERVEQTSRALGIRLPRGPSAGLAPVWGKVPNRRGGKIHAFPTAAERMNPPANNTGGSSPSDRYKKFGAKVKQAQVVTDAPAVEKGKYRTDVENAINSLSSLPPRGSIARCMEGFRNKISLNDFSLIFREFAQRGDWQRALRLFKYMQRQQWCKPNEHVYTIMIGIMGREGMLDKASELFEEMPSNEVEWNVYSFTALINAYGRNGQHEASLHLLARMKRERVTPNLITYNTVINACAKGGLEWEGLLGLFAQMRHEGIQPDIITYNTLLSACSSRGLVEEAGMVFRTMNEAGVVPDLVTYTSLVDTYGQAGQYEGAAELLREMERAGNVPDVVAYNVLIEAYTREGEVQAAAKVFKQMQQAGCAPNVGTFSTLLEAYGKHGRYDEVRSLFIDMKDRGTEPNVVTYNTLIDVLGQGGYWKEAVSIFQDMIEAECDPNLETYLVLLFACGKGGLHKEATKIYRHMCQQNISPPIEVYPGLINAYGKAAMYREAASAFQSMDESGCEPDQATYNALIETYSSGGLFKEAGAALWTMHEAGFPADVSTFNSLIEAYGKNGMFDDAVEVFRDMQEAKCPPNQQTYATLLSVYCTAGLFDEARAQFLEMKEGGLIPEVTAYCLMLSICARRNRWEDVGKMLEEMQGRSMPTLHSMVAGLMTGEYDTDSNWDLVEHVLDNLKIEGVGHNLEFYNGLLEALWFFGQRKRAARLLQEGRKRGVFVEAFRKTRMMWAVDVHRMSTGAALTTLIMWLLDMQEATMCGEELPPLVSIVTKWGALDENKDLKDVPIAKAVHSVLQTLGAPFGFAPWNLGRIVSRGQILQRWLQDSSFPDFLALDNTRLPLFVPNYAKSNLGKTRE